MASRGYWRRVLRVRGMTTTLARLRLAASLLTMTAGWVFRISLPTEGSNFTHQISPRFIARARITTRSLWRAYSKAIRPSPKAGALVDVRLAADALISMIGSSEAGTTQSVFRMKGESNIQSLKNERGQMLNHAHDDLPFPGNIGLRLTGTHGLNDLLCNLL